MYEIKLNVKHYIALYCRPNCSTKVL